MTDLNQLADAVAARLAGTASTPTNSTGTRLVPKASGRLDCQSVIVPVTFSFSAGRGKVQSTAYLMFGGEWANDLEGLATQLRECGFRVRGQYERDNGNYNGGYYRRERGYRS